MEKFHLVHGVINIRQMLERMNSDLSRPVSIGMLSRDREDEIGSQFIYKHIFVSHTICKQLFLSVVLSSWAHHCSVVTVLSFFHNPSLARCLQLVISCLLRQSLSACHRYRSLSPARLCQLGGVLQPCGSLA